MNTMYKLCVRLLALTGLATPLKSLAQSGSGAWGKLSEQGADAEEAFMSLGKNGCRIALVIGLVFVIYSLADNKNYSKIAVIAWCIGFGFYLMAFELLGN